jgi:hypothetical protein
MDWHSTTNQNNSHNTAPKQTIVRRNIQVLVLTRNNAELPSATKDGPTQGFNDLTHFWKRLSKTGKSMEKVSMHGSFSA